MSLSTALSLETLSPEELYLASEQDLPELCRFYDTNSNGQFDPDEFEVFVSEVVNRMATQLPALIPARYCAEYSLPSSALAGIEAKIAAKFQAVNRPALAKTLFKELDVIEMKPTAAEGGAATARNSARAQGGAEAAAAPTAVPAADAGDDAATTSRGYLEAWQMKPLHALMEKYLLKDLYESIGAMIVQKQLAALDGM